MLCSCILRPCPRCHAVCPMMKPDSTTVAVVLIGRFDPSAMRIEQLKSAKVLRESDIDQASYVVLVPEQAIELKLPWGKLAVVHERLGVDAFDVPFIRAADLAIRCVRELNPTSFVVRLGINWISHFKFSTSKERDDIGTRLMPPQAWGAWGISINDAIKRSDKQHGGMMSAIMRQTGLPDREAGWIDVKVEPSMIIKDDRGVSISINDHYEMKAGPDHEQPVMVVTEKLLNIIETSFDDSLERSASIAQNVLLGI